MQLSSSVNPAMSSLEISELVESRHDKVKQSIERLSARGVIQLPPLGEVKNHLGQTVSVYLVCKRDSYIVVAQLSPEFTARLVDRWQELENPVALSRMDILKLAMESEQRAIEAEHQLAIAAPKVQFVDSYVNATGSLGFRETCKLLHIKENAFRQFLLDHGIMYVLAGKLAPYAQHIDAGRFTVKTGENQQNGHAFTQTKFTPKGIQWIAGLWAAQQVQERAA